ncbi:hypothetical protein PRZ48_000249 [Zasmidium cellare]|uniref:Uncharacterized protein n=1 Tax=Zasmidium cellare TaxID=395010 RepID=A0ABR0EY01_ZASCE|nr:hypothetical protein PRZ48_000249 [Zasmidium cellare]
MSNKRYTFLIDTNLDLASTTPGWPETFARLCIDAEDTTDLEYMDAQLEEQIPDIAFMPSGDYHRLQRVGKCGYRGLAIPTSKMTGQPAVPSVVVVKHDDPAESLLDLRGATFGYINRSCTSCYFAAGVMLAQHNEDSRQFLKLQKTPPWQGQIDAVKSGEVRVTLVPEDVWKSDEENAKDTKVIGRWDDGVPGFVVARNDIDEAACDEFVKALVRWQPPWSNLYGPFKPFFLADVHRFFHAMDALPEGF